MGQLPVWLSTTLLGFGTVFVGLIALIYIVKLVSLIINKIPQKKAEPVKKAAPAAEPIENRQQFVAAVAAAIATVMGKDVSGIRIISIKKV